MVTMPTVAAVHENMHQRAGEAGEKVAPDDMREVFLSTKIRRHGTNRHVADGVSRTPEAGGDSCPSC